MRFDDRLKTVLAQRPTDAHDRAVRWRQLVELLARAAGPPSALGEQALAEVRSEAAAVDEQLRAATARAIAGPRVPTELIAAFAADTIAVAAPVLAAAKLAPDQWSAVLEEASPDSRRFLRALHPDVLPAESEPEEGAAPAAESEASTAPAPAPDRAIPSISEVVARIERLRQDRKSQAEAPPGPRRDGRKLGEPAAMFRWECGPSGEIAWVEGVPRGPLVGRSLASPGEHNGIDERIQRAFALRAPFREARLSVSGEGAVAGEWQVSGVPAFEPSDGRFAGYRGVAMRAERPAAPAAVDRQPPFDHDSLRELVHEIKTPLNAIIGFAEIIDGQYLGPADHGYRARAAEIVAEARLLLAAIEDLDLAARLRSAPARAGGSTEVNEVVAAITPELIERTARRGATLELDLAAPPVRCAIERSLAERIILRFCGSVIDAATAGERLRLAVTSEPEHCLVSIDRPETAVEAADRPRAGSRAAGADADRVLASAVSLRLVRALAQVTGGDLVEEGRRTALVLPRAKD